jgi:branched-chain amino acid transport system permease protein
MNASPTEVLAARGRLRPFELALWPLAVAVYFLADTYLTLGAQILVMILYALSLDLIVGYAGIVTLGHAAFFGLGAYTAGILAVRGFGEPIAGLLLAGLVSGAGGLISGAVILRTRGLTLVMLTLAVLLMLNEVANRANWLTGGADGLFGFQVWPLLGRFRFDIYGRTAYWYCLIVLFLGWLFVRMLVHSPFGRSLTGIRENARRMHAVGAPVRRRLVMAYTISAALAGISGALLAQTTQSVALSMIDLDRSGTVLVMLILGGVGRLYGAFVGVPVFMLAQDTLAKQDPTYWLFWIGVTVVAVVLFARGGILGIFDRLLAATRTWWRL